MNKQKKIGYVIRTTMLKTIIVLIIQKYIHKRYKKIIKQKKYLFVHDEHNKCKIGDTILIQTVKPISKFKHYKILKILYSKL